MSQNLANLEKTGQLKREKFAQAEFDGLVKSAKLRLADARKTDNAPASRFDLAYNASHALALAALRRQDYRSENRYIVFQALEHTAGLPAAKWRVLSKAHDARNMAEYEGEADVDLKLLDNLIDVATELEAILLKMK